MAETFLQRQQRVRGRQAQPQAPQQPAVAAPQPPPTQPRAQQAQSAVSAQGGAGGQQVAGQNPSQGATAASGANRPSPIDYGGGQVIAPGAAAAPAARSAAPATAPAAPASAAAGAATAPAATPAASYTPTQFSSWAQTTFGRAPTQQEFGQISAAIGAPAGPDGQYTQQQYERAQQEAERLARAQGWSGTVAPSTPTPPPFTQNTGVDPNVPGNVGHTGRVLVDPGQGYQANQLGAYQAPNTGNVNQLNTQLMERILANPESLPPELIAQMKAGGKASAAAQAEQLRGQASTALAGRGFSGAGGMQSAADGAVDRNFLETLLNSNRDTDIRAAGQNFQDRLSAVGAGSQFQNDATNRSVAQSGAEVQRFGANEGARQAQSADQLGRDTFRASQMSNDRSSNLNEWLSRQGVQLDNRRTDIAEKQFRQQFGLSIAQFLEGQRQYNQNFGEGSRQFNVGAGLSTAQLQQQSNDSLMNWLRQFGGI